MIHETLDAIDLSPVLSLCSWTNHRTIATSHISLPSMLLKNGIYQCYIPRLKKGIFILWRLSIQIHSHSIKENWAPLQKALCLNYQKRFWYTSCDFITMQPYSTLIYTSWNFERKVCILIPGPSQSSQYNGLHFQINTWTMCTECHAGLWCMNNPLWFSTYYIKMLDSRIKHKSHWLTWLI